MATAEWSRAGTRAHVSAPAGGAGPVLGAALLVLAGYAAFAEGATGSPAEPRLQVAIAAVALLAGGALWTRKLSFPSSRSFRAAALLLVAFAVWSGLSALWSAAPDRSWVEFNRVFAYAAVLALAGVAGASVRGCAAKAVYALLILAAVVVLYALGQKVLPGLDISGLISLNQTARYARLEQPLGYWNALALLFAICAPAVLVLAAKRDLSRRLRLASLITLQLMVVATGFTESRGGIVALAVALAATIWLSGAPLRHFAWTVVAALGGLAPLIVGLSSHSLTADQVPLGSRESAGLLLLLVLLAAATLLTLASTRLFDVERRIKLTAEHRGQLIRLLLIASAVGAVLAAVVFVAAGGLAGLTTPKQVSISDPNRLFSTDSADRWEWWHQAVGAWRSRPLAGWGAGSFQVLNLLYRHDTLTASDAHSVPLQWLAETGLIGTALAALAWFLLLRGGIDSLRQASKDRWAVAALIAAVLAYTVHALYDWDWEIPGVTLPVLAMLGVLGGALTVPTGQSAPLTTSKLTATGRSARLAGLAVVMCVFVVSAVLPGLAAGRASSALVQAGAGNLRIAQHDANVATRLDPLSDAGPLASSTIALQLKDLTAARSDTVEAVRREPDDWQAWLQLMAVDGSLNRWTQALQAAQRAIELNPEIGGTQLLQVALAARAADVNQAPPAGSATAQP